MADLNAPGGGNVADRDAGRSEGVVDKMKHTATSQLANQKNRAADGLGSVAQAVRQSSQHLRDNQQDTIARFTDQAADQIDRFNQTLRDKDIAELFDDVQQMARRQPALFIGGAFAVGLLASRFFKSSASEQRREWRGPSPERQYPRATASRLGTQGSPGGREVREYAGATGSGGYTSSDFSQVHDYEGSAASPDATGTPSSSASMETTADADAAAGRAGAPRSRARRTTQAERP
jgi:hypothetical protein